MAPTIMVSDAQGGQRISSKENPIYRLFFITVLKPCTVRAIGQRILGRELTMRNVVCVLVLKPCTEFLILSWEN
jgi:hypothetical protein